MYTHVYTYIHISVCVYIYIYIYIYTYVYIYIYICFHMASGRRSGRAGSFIQVNRDVPQPIVTAKRGNMYGFRGKLCATLNKNEWCSREVGRSGKVFRT